MDEKRLTTTTTTKATAATTGTTLGSLVDSNSAAIEPGTVSKAKRLCICRDVLNVVHCSNSSLRIGLLTIANKAEATRTAGVAVLDNDLCGS